MDLPISRPTKPSLHVELTAARCAAHSAKFSASRRRHGSLLLLVVGAVCLVSAFTELRPPTPIAFTAGSRSGAPIPSRGEKIKRRAEGDIEPPVPSSDLEVSLNAFWNKFAKSIGLSNAQDEARSRLKSLEKAADKTVQAEVETVQKAMKTVLAKQASVEQAQVAFKAAKQQAADLAVAAWNQNEEDWASELETLVVGLVKKGDALSGAVEELRNATADLTAACVAAEAGASKRAAKAEAAVKKLDAEAKEELSKEVAAATISLGDGRALRPYVLGKAAAIAANKALGARKEGDLADAKELTKELSELRAKRQAEEKAKQPPKPTPAPSAKEEPEKKEKPAEPTTESKEDESGGSGGVLFAAAFAVAAAVAAFVATGQQQMLPQQLQQMVPARSAPSAPSARTPVAVVTPGAKKEEAPKPAAPAPEAKKEEPPKPAAPAPAPPTPAPEAKKAEPPKPVAPAPAPPAPAPPAAEAKKEEPPKPAPAPAPPAPAPPAPGMDLKALLKAESAK